MNDTVRRLVGVGVGPGDPELVTLKAVRILSSADAILVPDTTLGASQAPGRAEQIVAAACPDAADKIVRVPFSMADPTGVTRRRAASWEASASAAIEAFESGATTVCFATIGDPSVYSTFSYLAAGVSERLPEVAIEVVPGITAMQALAATSRTPLVEGDEILALVPLKAGVADVAKLAPLVDTTVVYKPGRHFSALRAHLSERGCDAIVGVDVGTDRERIAAASELAEAPYFATVIIPPTRGEKGARL